jgi:hypothetical protein
MASTDWAAIIVVLALWGGLCLWLMMIRGWKLTLRSAFVMITGFAFFFALAAPTGQEFLNRLFMGDRPWLPWTAMILIVTAAWLILKVNES